jgi:hypothetical protein
MEMQRGCPQTNEHGFRDGRKLVRGPAEAQPAPLRLIRISTAYLRGCTEPRQVADNPALAAATGGVTTIVAVVRRDLPRPRRENPACGANMRCPDMFGWMVFVAWWHREPGRAVSAHLIPAPITLSSTPILSTPAIAYSTASGHGSMPLTSIFFGAVDAGKPCGRQADAMQQPDETKRT